MNSIILTHFAAPQTGAFALEIALDRLGAYLDAEMGKLEELLDTAERKEAIDDVVALQGLHLDAASAPADLRRLLENAQMSLAHLLESVRQIPFGCEITGPGAEEFDAWVRWSGARLEDIVTTLARAIAA